ncbi:UNVERIFIED_CONTAM: hypothetical protein GTU68_000696 [Idotea baltica]|nr:hypothetical protein [Idotea baltica]
MKILVVGPSWVGDMVMAQTLFMCLKQRYVSCDIDVLAPVWCRELLLCMPEVRSAIDLPIGHGSLELAIRYKISQDLRGRYDQAIILPNSLKSALIPFLAGIPLRTGWKGELRYGLLNDLRKLDKAKYPLMIERFMALAYDKDQKLPLNYPKPTLQVKHEQHQQLLKRLGVNQDLPILVLCPGAEFGESKRWPAKYYAQLAQQAITEKGVQVWLLGSKNDQPNANKITACMRAPFDKNLIDLTGKSTLGEAVNLLSLARAVVSNDSGLMHVAAALGRPLVAIYGSSSAQFTPPLVVPVEIVRSTLSCSPCFERTCRYGHYNCLRELSVCTVFQALERVMSNTPDDVRIL